MAPVAGLDIPSSQKQYLNLINFTPEEKLREREDKAILDSRGSPNPIVGLVAYVRQTFERHKNGRLDVEQAMLRSTRRIKREYEPDMLAALKAIDDPEDYSNHTTQKVHDAESWIIDILNPGTERIWDVKPTPIAELPPDIDNAIIDKIKAQVAMEILQYAEQTGTMPTPDQIMGVFKERQDKVQEDIKAARKEEAEKRASNMQLLITDQLIEGGWEKSFKQIIQDITRFKLCCLKGPIFKREKVLQWKEDPATGAWTPQVVPVIQVAFKRVAPLDYYPSPDSIEAGDGPEIEIEHVNRSEFQKLIDLPGYKSDVIRQVMTTYPVGYREMTPIDSDRYWLEKQNTYNLNDQNHFDVINYWGGVPGRYLLDWGISPADIPDPTLDYEVCVKIVGNMCIKAVLNPDTLDKHPYRTTSYEKSNDSQWGECPADMMEFLQGQLNNCARGLTKNIGWSAGPIWELDVKRTSIPGEVPEVWPNKTILSTPDQMGSNIPAVRMYTVPNQALPLLRVIEKLERIADDTVVPSYGSASKGGDAGKTAAGLSMLRTDSARKIKLAIYNIGMDVVMPAIQHLYNHNMRFYNDPLIKGDCRVETQGVFSVMAKEQMAVRRNEYLSTAIGNDTLLQIHGIKGIAYMVSEAIRSIDMNVDKAIPNYNAIESGTEDQAMGGMGGQVPIMGVPGMGRPTVMPPNQGVPVDVAGNKRNEIVQAGNR